MAVKIHRVVTLPETPVAGDYYLVKGSSGVSLYAAKTDGSGFLKLARQVKISGPTSLYHGEVGTYTIKDYTDKLTYQVTSSDGTVVRTGETFTFVCSDTAKTSALLLINGRNVVVTIKKIVVNPPAVLSPVEGSTTLLASNVVFTVAPFSMSYAGVTDTHVSSDWELATDAAFTKLTASSYNDTVNKLSWKPPA